MRIFIIVLASLFGILHELAGLTQMLQKKDKGPTGPMMVAGGILMLLAALLCGLKIPVDWPAALIGGGLICYAAYKNGKDSGQLHLQHHLIRGAVGLAIVLGMAFVA